MKDKPLVKPDLRHLGILPGAAHLAIEIVDRSHATLMGVMNDARTELRGVIEAGIELADKTTSSAMRFARKLVQRVDETVAESMGGIERLTSGALDTARDTTMAATDAVQSALSTVTGNGQARPSPIS